MKKSISLALVALAAAFCSTAHAQIIDAFGLRTGASISGITLRNAKSLLIGGSTEHFDEAVVNPLVGVYLENSSLKALPVRLEVIYTRMGAAETFSVPVTTAQNPDGGSRLELRSEFDMQYVILCLRAQPTMSFEGLNIYATLGPTLSYLFEVSYLVATDDELTRSVLGYYAGAGISLPLSSGPQVSLEVGYTDNFKAFYRAFTGEMTAHSLFVTLGVSL